LLTIFELPNANNIKNFITICEHLRNINVDEIALLQLQFTNYSLSAREFMSDHTQVKSRLNNYLRKSTHILHFMLYPVVILLSQIMRIVNYTTTSSVATDNVDSSLL